MSGRYIYGIKLLVGDEEKTAKWLCDNLFFEREPGDFGMAGRASQSAWTDGGLVVRNGRFHLILKSGGGQAAGVYEPDAMCLGLQHVALETWDIGRAIEYCRSRGLRLQLNGRGGARHSGKVYGTGMDYFNILTEFGFTIEVSQKLHCKKENTGHVIEGLEHVGMQVADTYEAVRFYENLGFEREFEPVVNRDAGHTVICCMVSAGGTTIELYEFEGMTDDGGRKPAVLDALVIAGGGSGTNLDGEEPFSAVRRIQGIAGEQIELIP